MAALSGGPNGPKGGDWLTQGIFDVSHVVDGPERYGAYTASPAARIALLAECCRLK
jgi:hypothetical protein